MSNDELELFNERAAIREHDGGMDRADAEIAAAADVEQHRHRCEINYLVELGRKEGRSGVDHYLGLVEKQRGADAAERLRSEARAVFVEGTR